LKKNKNLNLIVQSIEEKKGKNINTINLIKILNSPADFFVICNAQSRPQINAIANNIKLKLDEELKKKPWKEEGRDTDWRLLDYGDIVVHVFKDEARKHYNLDELWSEI
tara:strand:- start:240 stop:566 length:327 start_codon:yes stop_codon:yes gene_type:complete